MVEHVTTIEIDGISTEVPAKRLLDAIEDARGDDDVIGSAMGRSGDIVVFGDTFESDDGGYVVYGGDQSPHRPINWIERRAQAALDDGDFTEYLLENTSISDANDFYDPDDEEVEFGSFAMVGDDIVVSHDHICNVEIESLAQDENVGLGHLNCQDTRVYLGLQDERDE